jgi:hypothetical protein
MKRILVIALLALSTLPCQSQTPTAMVLDMEAVMEAVPLAIEAMEISERAAAREAKHVAELAKRGIAEVPASASVKYTLDAGAVGKFIFDNWGEFYIDRRFVTDAEMVTIRKIEAWFRKHFPAQLAPVKKRVNSGGVKGVPVFRGFEDARYQVHDAMILKMVRDFNANKAKWCGGSAEQAAKIPDLTPALVKSHMIEESGGNGKRSRDAWAIDPLQVNVPGDWGDEKTHVGLSKPVRRNEGTIAGNIKAAIMYLSRKGFSTAARPAADLPKATFSGWTTALRRYNGRRDRTDTDRYYSDEYADKIMRRANNPEKFEPIEIKLAAKTEKR